MNWVITCSCQVCGSFKTETLGDGPIRGMHVFQDVIYVVSGRGVYRVDINGGVTGLNVIANGGPVTMADNGSQVIICTPETGYAYVVTGTDVEQISDPDFLPASSVDVLDGYAVFSRLNSTAFFISDFRNALSYDGLQSENAEASPDNLIRVARVGQHVWLFGERTVEVWNNAGAPDFPFRRISGETMQIGCAARDSVAVHQSTPFWLGHDKQVYRAEGARPVPISHAALTQAIEGYPRVDDARGWFYVQESHSFYVLSFPSGGATWVFDLATGQWHERESEGYGGLYRHGCAVRFGGVIITGDIRRGRLYSLDPTVSSEAGDPIIRTWTGVPQHSAMKRLFFTRLALDLETGVGLPAGQGSDPKVWVRISQDGGRTYGPAMWAGLGARGAHRTTVEWRRLGAARDTVFQFGMSDPVPTTVYAMHLDAEVGED